MASSGARAGSPATLTEGPIALETRGVTKRFGGLTAVDNVDLKIPQGAIQGLIGPNGAGKTTFFNIIAGIYELTEGEILFEGTPIQLVRRAPPEEPALRPDQIAEPRHFTNVSEHPPVRQYDRAGERADRHAYPIALDSARRAAQIAIRQGRRAGRREARRGNCWSTSVWPAKRR